jgi:hypothetical protein
MTTCCWVAMYGRRKEAGDDRADDANDDVGKDDDGGNNGDDDADGDDEEDAAMIAVLTFAGTPGTEAGYGHTGMSILLASTVHVYVPVYNVPMVTQVPRGN